MMDAKKLEHFRGVLQQQLQHQTAEVREDQANALDFIAADDGVKDSVDMSLQDVNQEIALRLGEHKSQNIADIDEALLRIEEGTYGDCARCGNPINERRLEAMPTARYCAPCQTTIEANQGLDDTPSL